MGLLGDAIDTTYDKEADVRDAKAKVLDAIDKIHDGKKKLLKARSSAKKTRVDVYKRQFLTLPISVSGTKMRTKRSVGSIIVSSVLPGPAFWPALVVTETTLPSRGAVTTV